MDPMRLGEDVPQLTVADPFAGLRRSLSAARSKAAAFRKVDLHVHSWESDDYEKRSDKLDSINPEEDCPRDVIGFYDHAELSRKHLDIVAITDHNRSQIACELAGDSSSDTLVLPGMEISVKVEPVGERVLHLLAIFPADRVAADIDKVFPEGCGMPLYASRTDGSTVDQMHVSQLMDAIHEAGGICVAAHINSDSGVREDLRKGDLLLAPMVWQRDALRRMAEKEALSDEDQLALEELEERLSGREDTLQNDLLRFLAEKDVDAVEVQKPTDRQFYEGVHCDTLGIRPIACLLSSDAHRPRDIGEGGYATYLKMGSVSFDGLRRALQDPSVRIRFAEEVEAARYPRIIGLEFSRVDEAAECVGFFDDEHIGFSDDLTCLIGGRGSGKSTIVDALRYLFMVPTDDVPRDLLSDVNGRWERTLRNTRLRAIIVTGDDQEVILTREYDAQGSVETSVTDRSGIEIPVRWPNTEDFSVQLFGWSEIEKLAQDSTHQRNLLDRHLADANSLVNARDRAYDALRENKDDLIAAAREMNSKRALIGDLPQKQAMLEVLETDEMQEAFVELDAARREVSALGELTQVVSELAASYDAVPAVDEPGATRLDGIVAAAVEDCKRAVGEDSSLGTWLAMHGDRIGAVAQAAEDGRIQTHREMSYLVGFFDERSIAASETMAGLMTSITEKAIEAHRDQIAGGDTSEAQVVDLVGQRDQLAREVANLEAIERELNEHKAEWRVLLVARTTLRQLLAQAQGDLFEARNEKAAQVGEPLAQMGGRAQVSVSWEAGGDRKEWALAIEEALHGIGLHYKENAWAEQIAASVDPRGFVDSVLEDRHQELEIPQTATASGITAEQAQRIVGHLTPSACEGDAAYDIDKLERLLAMEQVVLDDRPAITLDGERIEALSPGQRCSAVLPLVLLEGTTPLVIDQPEDNLDAALVFEVLVNVLRAMKQRRQIIVATHNPNIPVSGDAEQIIVLKAQSKIRGTIAAQASIDDPNIIRHVTDIMEGSREAFEFRAQKYGYTIKLRSLGEAIEGE